MNLKQAGLIALSILALVMVVIFGSIATGCATTGPFTACNPVMEQCNPADLPPLAAQLPPWPFPRLFKPITEGTP